jgi:hypothetical protein
MELYLQASNTTAGAVKLRYRADFAFYLNVTDYEDSRYLIISARQLHLSAELSTLSCCYINYVIVQ